MLAIIRNYLSYMFKIIINIKKWEGQNQSMLLVATMLSFCQRKCLIKIARQLQHICNTGSIALMAVTSVSPT